jgi:hypothetical protein
LFDAVTIPERLEVVMRLCCHRDRFAAVAACALLVSLSLTLERKAHAAQDYITTINGAEYYVVAATGTKYPLQPLSSMAESPALAAVPAGIIPILSPLPARVMLDEEGYVTPVKDQGPRTSCTVFAAVGAIESEILRQFGTSPSLSEEYLINMMNEDRNPSWTGGSVGEKLYVASYYGLPTESDWPYIGDATLVDAAECKAFGIQYGTAACNSMESEAWTDPLVRDIANYTRLVYPNFQAHHDAINGPAYEAVGKVPFSNVDPTPLETLIAEGHPIAFGLNLDQWAQNPQTGIEEYRSSSKTNGHAMLLVGYDRNTQLFRVKNSWGTGWGNHQGLGDATYDVVLKTMYEAWYVTNVRAPSAREGGNGGARGFYRGVLDGRPGVAVIHHAFPDHGLTTTVSHDAGYFYATDSTVIPIQWSSGDDLAVTLTVPGYDIQTIQLVWDGRGWVYTGSGNDPNGDQYEASGLWCRSEAPSGTPNLDPQTYLETPSDPNVFTNLPCSPSESLQKVTTPKCTSTPAICCARAGGNWDGKTCE